jgi:hypothetical protein
VSGPVVFELETGSYYGFKLGTIPGVSSTNTVTVTSVIHNREAVVIGEGNAPFVQLDDARHIHFRDVTIGNIAGADNVVAVRFAGYIEDVLFHHCNLYANTTTSSSDARVVEYNNASGASDYMRDVRFIGNNVRGGTYGFYLMYAGGNAANCKTSAAKRAGIRIDSNRIYEQYSYPFYSNGYIHVESFSHNLIESRFGASGNYGAYFGQYCLVDSIVGNRIHINVTNYAYGGIRLYNYTNYTPVFGQDILPALVANNEIISIAATNAYGIYAYYYINASIVNNSIYCKSETNYPIYIGTQSSNCPLEILNNMVVTENGSTNNHMIYCTAAATLTSCPTKMDYNNYYTLGTKAGTFYCGSARPFANWTATYALDAHSVQVKPDFRNLPDDLAIGQFSDQLKCNRHDRVMCDFNNDVRTSLTIMGAYSIPLFEGYNLQLEAYVEPVVGGIRCFPNNTPVKLSLYNMGTYEANFSASPVTLHLKCESDSVNFVKTMRLDRGGIGVMKHDTFEVYANLDVTYAGMYKLTAWLEWAKDQQRIDDTLLLDYYVDKTVLPYDNNFTGQSAGVATNQAYGDIAWEVVNDNPVLQPVFGTGSLLFRSSEGRGSISQALFSSVRLQGSYRPQLYFWYAHDNANPNMRDQMDVRISQDGGVTFKTIYTAYRYDANCKQPVWKRHQVDLSKFTSGSCIVLAFTAYSYGGGDQSIDQVKIVAMQDMQLTVDVPSDTMFHACNLTGHTLTAYLENMTSQEVPFKPGDSITVLMSGATNFVYKKALSGRLEDYEIDTLQLGPIDYSAGGKFDVTVYVTSVDSNTSNDTVRFSLNLIPDLALTRNDVIGIKEAGDTIHVGFTMQNTGNLDIVSPFDVQVVVNGEDTVIERVSTPIAVGGTLHYRFNQAVTVPPTTPEQPFYLIEVRALLSCDARPENDSLQILGNVNIVDNGILSIITPSSGQCNMGGELSKVEVRLFNNGNVDNADSVVLTAVIDSAGVPFATLTEKVAPMYHGENRNYTFRQQYRVPRLSVNGVQSTYKVRVFVSALDGDIDVSNDTSYVEACVKGGVGIEEAMSERWNVGQNVPNPASEMTRIPYTIPASGMLKLRIMGMNGQVLYREEVAAEAGSGDLRVNLSGFAAGVYYYSVEYRGERIVRKMNVVR